MTKKDEKELVQMVADNTNQLVQLRTIVVGVNGDNGLNGRQKEMEREHEALREVVQGIREDFAVMRSDVSDMKKSAKFWTRTIGSAMLIQIIAVLFQLLK